MTITITIDTDNSAWEAAPRRELRYVLGQVVDWYLTDRKLLDTNGNATGKVEYDFSD